MENNHAISAYEGELKARNDIINVLQSRLSATQEATDSERSTLAQKKKEIKALRALLEEKDELIASLNVELETARLSKEQVRKETELLCIDKVQGRFIQIGEALRELRRGPMYRLNLMGQTVNNMSLVKDLRSANPPVLADEMAALEREMSTYSGATEEFEAAFGEIMHLLLGESLDSDSVNSQDRPPELAQDETEKEHASGDSANKRSGVSFDDANL